MNLEQLNEALLTMSDEEIAALATYLAERMEELRTPRLNLMELFVTHGCNLACDYCFVNAKSGKRRMTWEVAQKAVDFLMHHSRDLSEVGITFFGGEPLLMLDLMERVAAYARSRADEAGKKVSFALTTNGVLLNERALRFARECGFRYLVSIDGTKEVHDRHRRTFSGEGSFDIVMSKLPMLKAHQGWVGARMTIGPDTVGSLSESVQFLFRAGVNQFLIGCVDDSVWDQAALETLRRELRSTLAFYRTMKSQRAPIRINPFDEGLAGRKERVCDLWGCGAGSTRIAVTAEGDLYPCCRFVGLNYRQDAYWLGDLNRGIVRRDRVYELADNRVNIRYPCFSCDLGAYCGGGCPAVNLQGSGSIYFPGFSQCGVNRVWVEVLQEEERNRQTIASPVREEVSTGEARTPKHFRLPVTPGTTAVKTSL